jgi:hypothetical protein
MEADRNTARNNYLMKCHPQCRLCHYSGYSNVCNFLETGVCPYNVGLSIAKGRKEVSFGGK